MATPRRLVACSTKDSEPIDWHASALQIRTTDLPRGQELKSR
jgi:hypothetical protein